MIVASLLAVGIASWFKPYQAMYDGMKVCAMPHADSRRLIGKTVRISNLDNGRHSRCVVIGNGPFVAVRVIDVSPIVRDELGIFGAGLANVRVYQVP